MAICSRRSSCRERGRGRGCDDSGSGIAVEVLEVLGGVAAVVAVAETVAGAAGGDGGYGMDVVVDVMAMES